MQALNTWGAIAQALDPYLAEHGGKSALVQPPLATRHDIRTLHRPHGCTLTAAVNLRLHEYTQQLPTARIDRYFQFGVVELAT